MDDQCHIYTSGLSDAPEPIHDEEIEPVQSLSVDDITVGLSMDTLIEERWQKDRDMFSEAVQELGADIIVKAANGNDALQIAQAERMISDGVDVLVLVPHNAEAAATIVGRAQAAGIPVISYDRLVKNANVDLYISFDNEEVGRLQAEAMLKAVPSGQYVYIGGASTDNNAHLMREGVYEVLKLISMQDAYKSSMMNGPTPGNRVKQKQTCWKHYQLTITTLMRSLPQMMPRLEV